MQRYEVTTIDTNGHHTTLNINATTKDEAGVTAMRLARTRHEKIVALDIYGPISHTDEIINIVVR